MSSVHSNPRLLWKELQLDGWVLGGPLRLHFWALEIYLLDKKRQATRLISLFPAASEWGMQPPLTTILLWAPITILSYMAIPAESASERPRLREGRSEERRVGKECRSRWS